MPVADDTPLHDFLDRAFRESLQQPDNLRDFLHQVVPNLAAGFICERARLLTREFPLDDWRRRESDLLFEIPYRSGVDEQTALVCVLIEHQSNADPRMALRLLVYAVLYWDRQWKAWEQSESPRSPLRLTPVVPIVLHTGSTPWRTHRQLTDLLSGPEAFHAFAPRWQPLFWDLAEQSPQALLNAAEEWLQALAVVRVEEAGAADFREVFTQALHRLEALHDRNRVRWYDLLRLLLTWAAWRRPRTERDELMATASASQADATRRREVQNMGQTIAEAWIEQGRSEGRVEGNVEALRKTLLRLGRQRFGEPGEPIVAQVAVIGEVDRLESLTDRLLQVSSWQELLDTP